MIYRTGQTIPKRRIGFRFLTREQGAEEFQDSFTIGHAINNGINQRRCRGPSAEIVGGPIQEELVDSG